MIGVKKALDLAKRLSLGVIGEDFDMDCGSVMVAEVRGKLYFRMHWVIVLNEASDKTNDNRVSRVGYRRGLS